MKITAVQLRKIIVEEANGLNPRGTFLSKLARRLREAEEIAREIPGNLDVTAGPSSTIEWLNGEGADPRVRALLNSGRRDGKPTDETATVSEGSATIGDLLPTQIEIDLTKSIGYPLASFDHLKKMISGGVQKIGPAGNDMIVTSGNLIIDGHHRWSSLFSVAGPSGQIAAIDIQLPEKDAASVLAIVQTAIASTLTGGEAVPKAKVQPGTNILGKSRDEIAEMIRSSYESGTGEAGPILTDKFVNKCLDDAQVSEYFGLDQLSVEIPSRGRGPAGSRRIDDARDKIIDVVADNLSQMNQPAEGSPPRTDMPQLDKAKGGVQGALDKLAAGKVNYKPPFKIVDKEVDDNKRESLERSSQIVSERWQRLAGIIKGR